jgi:hypothetical protein
MKFEIHTRSAGVALAILLLAAPGWQAHAQDAQQAAAAATEEDAPEPMSAEELEVLVARIALYPDQLVALIASASLYPLQIVEAARYLDKKATEASLQPKEGWDGSIVSLLNYPEIVRMMSDDLDWTQTLSDALAYQQKDVLIAIQQLRDEAVADGIIKSDDKVQVVNQGDNIVIEPASPEVIYVPQYDPQVLYVDNYPPAPVSYYPDPYPYYYNPVAPYFAGAVTGAVFAAAVDWDDWGVWGGDWDGGDIDIDCNNCFNDRDFNGKMNFNDVDWKNVDRSKINFNRNDFNNLERNDVVRNDLKQNNRNNLKNKSTNVRNDRTTKVAKKSEKVGDVRKNQVSAKNEVKRQQKATAKRPEGQRNDGSRAGADRPQAKKATSPGKRPNEVKRKTQKPKPAAKKDNRSRNPSALGEVRGGKQAKAHSNRGKSARPPQRRPSGGNRGGGGGGGRRR